MAIDGVIAWISAGRDDESGAPTLDLFLVERPDRGAPPRGQPTLRILDPTWRPDIGMPIWGGDSHCFIVTDFPDPLKDRQYERIGHTRLREVRA